MTAPEGGEPTLSLLLLRTTRGLLVAPAYRALVAAIAVGYAAVAVIVGGMLQISLSGGGPAPFLWIVPGGAGRGWSYPAILAGGPHFLLFLPLLSTMFMVCTAAGVGLGMSAAVYIGARVLRPRPSRGSSAGVTTSLAGLTPAMLALLTLGACCSTTAAASAGIVAMARASGTTTTAVLVNTWYIGLFQVVMVYVALLAQERLVVVYEFFYGAERRTNVPTAPVSWRRIGGSIFRLVLIGSGLVWALSGLTFWFSVPVANTPLAAWFGVLVQHIVPGALAVVAGLVPNEFASRLADGKTVWLQHATRGLAAVSGVALLSWLPPSWASQGAPALFNEWAGVLGWPAGWGAVIPPSPDPLAIGLRWVLGFVLVGGFALALALRPEPTLRALGRRFASVRSNASARGALPGPDAAEPG